MGASPRAGLLVALILALPALAPACKRRAADEAAHGPELLAVPMLGEVMVAHMGDPTSLPEGVHFDDKALTEAARKQLDEARIFARGAGEGGEPLPPKASVLAGYEVEKVWVQGKGLARAQVKLRVGIKPQQAADPDWAEEVEATGEIPYEADSAESAPARAFTSLVSRMLRDMLAEYIARQQLRTAAPEEVTAVIARGPGPLREDAIRVAGQRKLKGAAEPLLKLLNDEEETVRDAALGALVKLREPRAVAILAESRSMRDTREMRKILTAIALLGGREAHEYLKFVIDAHEDEEIRQLAQEALGRLERKRSPRP